MGPKSENNRNEERSEESAGKDYRDKEGKKGKRRKTILSRPKCRRPGKKRGSGERIRRQVGDK